MNYNFKPFEELEFSDDWMFKKVMENKEICKKVIERLLNIQVADITYPELDKTISPYYMSKGVRLDVYVKDSDRIFDLEMQSYKEDNIGKRMRFYQSMIDTNSLLKGENYNDLKESYILFICKQNPFKKSNLPVYTFRNICSEDREIILNDKSTKIVYNASAYEDEKDPELKAFLKYIDNESTGDDLTDVISKIVAGIKQTENNKEEYLAMNLHDYDVYRRGKDEGVQLGIAEGEISGAQKKALENAENFLKEGDSPEKIARCIGLPLETVLELQKSLSVNS